jgi:hypothetical protein
LDEIPRGSILHTPFARCPAAIGAQGFTIAIGARTMPVMTVSQVVLLASLNQESKGFGGRCRVRTYDPCRVKAVLYR